MQKVVYVSSESSHPSANVSWGRPGHGHCHQEYTWTELRKGYKDNYIPFKVGGLGKRLEPLEPRAPPPLLSNAVAAEAAAQAGYAPKAGGEKRGMTW